METSCVVKVNPLDESTLEIWAWVTVPVPVERQPAPVHVMVSTWEAVLRRMLMVGVPPPRSAVKLRLMGLVDVIGLPGADVGTAGDVHVVVAAWRSLVIACWAVCR